MNALPTVVETGSVEGGTESRGDGGGDRDARDVPDIREGKDCD